MNEYVEEKIFCKNLHRLYKNINSKEAHEFFLKHPNLLQRYHNSREKWVRLWKEDPCKILSEIINNLPNNYKDIIDMGCGVNPLKKFLNEDKNLIGVDHINVTNDPDIIEGDMSDLKNVVDDESKDVMVFCVSIVATNFKDYFLEAKRILKDGGILLISEPIGKFGEKALYGKIEDFICLIETYGFKHIEHFESSNGGLIYFKFNKTHS